MGISAYFDVTATPNWSDLRKRDQRSFLSLIAEPDQNGCCAWHGQMRAGCPDWTRIDTATRTRLRGQARRLLVQSRGVHISKTDQVVVTCENPGCMSWEHIFVDRRQALAITAEEKRAALKEAEGRVQHCDKHPGAAFRPCFRRRGGRASVYFKCTHCERHKRDSKNRAGRNYKVTRSDF